LTEDEVLQILNLIEKSTFDFLQLELGDLKLTVSKSGYVPSAGVNPAPAAATPIQVSHPPVAEPKDETIQVKPVEPESKPPEESVMEGTVPIKAPMVGTFYTAPEPGAPPFVQAGGPVDEDTTMGLIEVMKVFTAVQCGVRGVIAKVCVENGQFVEYGQALFLVRPEGKSNGEDPSE
jgi:acetyl-CoA carboxylase biotin carboxyl carrier protein